MKKYIITIDDNLAQFYEELAEAINRTTEEVIQDTLLKVAEIIYKKIL